MHHPIGRRDGALGHEHVLLRLDQQCIHTADNQPAHLLSIRFLHRIPCRMPQREQFRAWAHRANHIPRPLRRLEPPARPPGDLRGPFVDLKHPVGHVGFGHHNPVTAEGVGLNGIAPDTQESLVDFLNYLRTRQVQHLGHVLVPQPIPFDIETTLLEVGSHCPIKNNDTAADQFDKGNAGHGQVLSDKGVMFIYRPN